MLIRGLFTKGIHIAMKGPRHRITIKGISMTLKGMVVAIKEPPSNILSMTMTRKGTVGRGMLVTMVTLHTMGERGVHVTKI